VYALGAVTYEMLIGEPPFTGPTVQAIVARLIAEAPRPLTAQRRSVPAHVEAVVLQALERLPADRFATPAEFATALEDRPVSGTIGVRQEGARPGRLRSWMPWVLTLAALGLLAFNLLRPGPSNGPQSVQRFSIVLPANGTWEDDPYLSFALSPDASLLAYNGLDSASHRRLYIRAMDRDTPTPVSGSETAHFPAFSPDARWLGFILNSRLLRVRVTGGTPEPICDVGGLSHWSWLGIDDAIFIDASGMKRCSTTGDVSMVLASDSTESFQFPHALPDGRHVLFGRRRGSESRLAAIDLTTHVVTSLGILGSDPRYVTSGYLVYATSDGSIRAVPFDGKALKVAGEPMVVGVSVHIDGLGRAFMAVSRGGTIVAPPASSFERALTLVDRGGRAEPLYPRPGDFSAPRFSPDGRRVAVSAGPGIWQLDLAQGTLTRVSFDEGSAERPAWSPDGKRIAYVRRNGPRNDIRIVDADGGRPPQTLLSRSGVEPWHVLFTPDGSSIIVRTVGTTGGRDILRVMLDSARQTTPLLGSTAEEVSPSLSPDGKWLAYASNESGRYEVYVRSFPSMTNRTQISLEGGSEPMWSPRGNEVFYRTGMTLMAAEVRLGSSGEVVRRSPLFALAGYDDEATYQNYDVAPDGHHFVMVRVLGDPSRPLSITLNRFEHVESSLAARRGQ
jgi:serine/threonine-protein kinase